MTATLIEPAATAPPPARRRVRERLARLERPLSLAGVALVALHLLDLAFSGPDTAVQGVLGIAAVPAGWVAAQPRLIRPTRVALALLVGLLALGFGVASHGLHVVNSGPDWRDLSGVGMLAGGLLLLASGAVALVAPRRAPRRAGLGWRAAHGVAWGAVAVVTLIFGMVPLGSALLITHAPRWAIQEASLGIPHEEVTVRAPGGRALSAWYVPSRNGAGILVDHGSGGSRERVAAHVRMLARHGYGVLALDLAGNGESEGHSNGLGDNAQPAIDAALDYLENRPDVRPDRIAGFGVSMGGEVLIEAAARDPRLRALVSDGGARPQDAEAAGENQPLEGLSTDLQLAVVRAISGMRPSGSLNPLIGRIAPRPVLLVASGAPKETPTNRTYQRHGGPTTELYELPEAAHTGGLRARPEEYERRTTAFLDRALDL
jgi:pimeloyl-ACP methyl ester carboxylesterase